jgi:hypothetical protein
MILQHRMEHIPALNLGGILLVDTTAGKGKFYEYNL